MRFLLLLVLVAQEKPPRKEDPASLDAKKEAAKRIEELAARMTKAGLKSEAMDCDSILRKLADPTKIMPERGGNSPWPGDENYTKILMDWTETGTALAGIFKEAAEKIADKQDKEWAVIFSEWFATFGQLAEGVRHLNRRRKFCKIGPVMLDWSASFGGYMHGRYMKINKDDPSTAGLGAHNEDPKLPGYSPEGAGAAGGILGGGDSKSVMDAWLGSAFHRDPVLKPYVGRIAFGGGHGWWSCKDGGGTAAEKPGTKILHFPGDGDTECPTAFGGEAPDPLPKGMGSAGAMIIVEYLGSQPKKPQYRLLDDAGNEVKILMLQKFSPVYFVAEKSLKSRTKYKVEITAQDGFKYEFTFTTR